MPNAPKLHVVITSTRKQRIGDKIGAWFAERARAQAKFEVEIVDLREVNLPIFDEPKHPRFRQYEGEHAKAWSARVAGADAFVFVVPEYNFGVPPSLVNALDYLYFEWNYKPAAFVSYGGVSGGTRSVQMAKMILTTLKMMPIPDAVTIAMVQQTLDAQGFFKGGEAFDKAASALLDELLRWTDALRVLRA